MSRGENAFYAVITAILLFAVLWYAWNDDGFGKRESEPAPVDTLEVAIAHVDSVWASDYISIRIRAIGPEWMMSEGLAPVVSRGSLERFQRLWLDGRLYYVIPADSIEVIP